MELFIKNMVSNRCKMIVMAELKNLRLHCINVELGKAEIKEKLSAKKYDQLKTALLKYDLELMSDRKNVLVEKIKNVIVEMVHYSDELPKIKFSYYLSEKTKHSYNYLASIFSEEKGTTIEHYIIAHKIERVKELLLYEEMSVSEIAWKLQYSSVAHLSSQFKKVTGITPTQFLKVKVPRLIPLENVGMR